MPIMNYAGTHMHHCVYVCVYARVCVLNLTIILCGGRLTKQKLRYNSKLHRPPLFLWHSNVRSSD